MNINHNNTIILNTSILKFLGITIDNTLSWKSHIDMITPKLSQASYIVRVVKPFLSWHTLKMTIMLTFFLLWFIGKYCGEIPHTLIIFLGLKKFNRIIMRARTRDSGRELFKILTILPLTSQCIFSLSLSMVNKSLCIKNSQLNNIKTMKNSTLFQLLSHLKI